MKSKDESTSFDSFKVGGKDFSEREIIKIFHREETKYVLYAFKDQNNFEDIGYEYDLNDPQYFLPNHTLSEFTYIDSLIPENSENFNFKLKYMADIIKIQIQDGEEQSLLMLNRLKSKIFSELKKMESITYLKNVQLLYWFCALCFTLYLFPPPSVVINYFGYNKLKLISQCCYCLCFSGVGGVLSQLIFINNRKNDKGYKEITALDGLFKMSVAFIGGLVVFLMANANFLPKSFSISIFKIILVSFVVGFNDKILISILSSLSFSLQEFFERNLEKDINNVNTKLNEITKKLNNNLLENKIKELNKLKKSETITEDQYNIEIKKLLDNIN